MSPAIAPFLPEHLAGFKAVHDHFATEGFALFSAEQADEMFLNYLAYIKKKGYPVYSLLNQDASVGGYGFLAPYGHTAAFDHAAMASVYLLPQHQRQGLGSRLLQQLETDAAEGGILTILASVVQGNAPSLAFFKRQGYVRVGCFRGVGLKFGRKLDQVWLQKHLE